MGHIVYQDPSSDKIVGMSNPLPVQVVSGGGGSSDNGTDATGVTPPAGATGIRGWLSSIFNLFNTGTAKAINYNGSGVETFTAANPANVALQSAGTTGATTPTKAVMLGASDGTNLQGLQVDGSKNLKVVLAGPGTGSYGNSDNNGIATNSQVVSSWNQLFNGSSWDRQRSIQGTLGVVSTPVSGLQTMYITTATTTVVKGSKGCIGTIINADASTSGLISIYDNTTATGSLLWSGTLTAGQVLPLGLPCGTGITVVTASANKISLSFA